MFSSIRNKMIVFIIVPTLVILLGSFIITLFFSVNTIEARDYDEMKRTGEKYAGYLNGVFSSNQMAGQMLAGVIESNQTKDRQEVIDTLHHLLLQHPEALAFYVGFEPNAFDGRDNEYASKPGYDSSGRFVPYWNRLTGTEKLDPLIDYDISDWYLLPKKLKTSVVMEPLLYEGVLMTSFITPVLDEKGDFLGIAGMDVSLQTLDEEVSQIKVLNTGYAFLVSNSGVLVSYPDKSFIGKAMTLKLAGSEDQVKTSKMFDDIHNGREGLITLTDPILRQSVVMFYTPIPTGNWSLVIVAPLGEMLSDLNDLRNISLFTGIAAIILLLVCIIYISTRITYSIDELKSAALRIADGDLDVYVEVKSNDELGQMASAFNAMVAFLKETSGKLTRVAEGDLSIEVPIKSEVDVLGHAFRKMVHNLQTTTNNLLKEQLLIQTLLENHPDIIYFKDLQSQFTRISRSLAQRFGLSDPAEAVGKTDFDFYIQQHAQTAFEDEQNIIKTGQALIDKEERELYADGRIAWLLSNKMPIKDADGNIIGTFGISHDITRRRSMEDELRTSQQRMNLVLDAAKMGVWDVDLINNTTWRTLKHDQIYGFDSLAPEWGLENFLEHVVSEERHNVYKLLEEAFKTDDLYIENRILRLDQELRWIAIQGKIYKNESGIPVRMLGTIVDITDRKSTELSLQKRLRELETVNRLATAVNVESHLQSLLQAFMDETLKTINTEVGAVLLYNAMTQHLEWVVARGWFEHLVNIPVDPVEGVSGYVFSHNKPRVSRELKKDELLARRFVDLIPDQWGAAILPIRSSEGAIGVLFVAVQLPRIVSENELRLLTIISQLAGNAIARARLDEQLKSANQELQKEVTQRAMMQDMLAAEKDLLNTTLMSISEGVITIDKAGLITFMNQSAENIVGYSVSNALERPVESIFRILDIETDQVIPNVVENLYEMDRSQKENINYKIPTLLTGNNEKRLVGGSISAIKNVNKAITGHVLVFQDVTEKQILEAQSMLSQKMEAIGQLAAGIAHEINTPIQYIGDNLSFLNRAFLKINEMLDVYQQGLQDHLETALTAAELEYFNQERETRKIQRYGKEIPGAIQESIEGVERVRKIVLAIREFSHPSQKEMRLADINHGIETTITISRNEWKYCADMETDLDPDLPLVLCQIDEINQVILNMIINASQAIQEKLKDSADQKGKIKITTREGINGRISIAITDTGGGIPEAIQGRIFDPFFTTKGVGKGTGQGLSMAHNIIVKKHAGMILVDSQVGLGTTFTIELPINPEKEGLA